MAGVRPIHAKVLKYLYINASEGQSSGGHIALRFTSDTFHFQHFQSGIIRLVKQGNTAFDEQYRLLENRTIYQTVIPISRESYLQLWQQLNQQLLQEAQEEKYLKTLDMNMAFLRGEYGHAGLQLIGAGLFSTGAKVKIAELGSRDLQKKIHQRIGKNFLIHEIKRLKQQLLTTKIKAWMSPAPFKDEAFLTVPYSFARRYIDTVNHLLLLQIIQDKKFLNTRYSFAPRHPIFQLTAPQVAQLSALQQQLLTHLLGLINSKSSEVGRSGFILYARILSLAQSIQSGQLIFLDTFLDNSQITHVTEDAPHRSQLLVEKEQALRQVLQQQKHLFTSPVLSEKEYSQLEMLSNAYYERVRGLELKQPIRVRGEQRLPQHSIPLPPLYYPALNLQQAQTEIEHLKQYRKTLIAYRQSYAAYDLFKRNCVTEIFSVLTKVRFHESTEAVFSSIDKDALHFIPAYAFQRMADDLPITRFPSFRAMQLQKMYAKENDLTVYLREVNTLSATYYYYNTQDTPFLFFTDDQVWLRPVLGVFNLLTATVIGLYGGFTLPFDSGKTLKSGVMGILMSIPELAFFNIRKGRYQKSNQLQHSAF